MLQVAGSFGRHIVAVLAGVLAVVLAFVLGEGAALVVDKGVGKVVVVVFVGRPFAVVATANGVGVLLPTVGEACEFPRAPEDEPLLVPSPGVELLLALSVDALARASPSHVALAPPPLLVAA